jgi:hypothetical protein
MGEVYDIAIDARTTRTGDVGAVGSSNVGTSGELVLPLTKQGVWDSLIAWIDGRELWPRGDRILWKKN